jgi:hypothetical protein
MLTPIRGGLALAALLVVFLTAPRLAWAVEFTKYSARAEDKKVILVFSFGEAVDYDPVFHYDKNYVALKVKDLKLKRGQNGKDYYPSGEAQQACFKQVSLTQGKGEGEIRIALAKGRSPGDSLVVPEGSKIIVEILLPQALMKNSAPPSEPAFMPDIQRESGVESEAAADADAAANGDSDAAAAGNRSWPPRDETAGEAAGEAADSDPGGLREGGDALEGGVDAEPFLEAADAVFADAAAGGGDLPGLDPIETGVTPGRSYKLFDLAQVPAAQSQFSNMALNEAVKELVATSGFNVVVGEGVSDMPVTLSFEQSQMSLKRALELLCVAYSLEYWVEDDAIVLRGKL